MIALTAVLLIALAGHSTPRSDEASRTSRWTVEAVRQAAVQNASGAALIESERQALAATTGRRQDELAAQARTLRSVLGHLADHDRNRAAAEALELYYRIVGIETQIGLAQDAREVVDALLEMAKRAEALELPDGNRNEFRLQRLEVDDQLVRLVAARRAALRRLARLIEYPTDRSDSLTLSDRLPATSDGERAGERLPERLHAPGQTSAVDDDPDSPVHVAMRNRSDLHAADAMCRCLSTDTLPAARTLMGVLRPGLGLATAVAGGGGLLARLHGDRGDAAELIRRRRQCDLLRRSTRDTIRDDVALALANLHRATQRVRIAAERESIAISVAEDSDSAVRLEQAAPGSERVALLEALRLAAETIDRRVELAVAKVELMKAQGTLRQTSIH